MIPVISRHKLSNKASHKHLLKEIEETLSYPTFYKRMYSKFYTICTMYMGNFEWVKIGKCDKFYPPIICFYVEPVLVTPAAHFVNILNYN